MTSSERPTYFYLFPNGDEIEIKPMTDLEADALYKQGKHWLDIPKKTLAEAEALRRVLLKSQR